MRSKQIKIFTDTDSINLEYKINKFMFDNTVLTSDIESIIDIKITSQYLNLNSIVFDSNQSKLRYTATIFYLADIPDT